MTDRAVSTTVNYVLALAITTLLVAGLFVSMSGFVAGQQERAVRSELTVIGNRVADDLAAVDHLAALTRETGTGAGAARATLSLPERVAGSTYVIRVEPGAEAGRYELTLASAHPEVSVTVHVRTRTPVETGAVAGGDLVVSYDDDATGRLEVDDA